MSILGNEILVTLLIGAAVFGFGLFRGEQIYLWLYQKSLGQREEIIRKLDMMFVEVNRTQITALMLVSSYGLGFLAFVALWPRWGLGVFVAAIITIVGWNIPALIVNNLYEARLSRFTDQMIDGLTIMANGVKAGLSITQAMERVVDNLPNPISQEFGLALSQIRVGMSVEEALNELGERLPRPDVQMFVTSITVLKETGGNLAETFETIVLVIRERQKVEKKIEAMTAQGLTQGMIITAVPLALMAVFFFMDPNFIRPLFSTTVGLIILMVIFALQIIGWFMIKKIVKIQI
jgi:tight adherence protein B